MSVFEPVKSALKNYLFLRYSERFLFLALMLSLFGILVVFSASASFGRHELNSDFYYLVRQSSFLIIGLFSFILFSKIPPITLQKYSYPLLGIVFLLLVMVLVPSFGQLKYGARRWFNLFGFGLQPAELLKFVYIVWLAAFISRKTDLLNSFKHIIVPPLIVLSICAALLLMQPDFGTIMLLIAVTISMLFYAGVNNKHLALCCLIGLVFASIAIYSDSYRMERIIAYLNPWADYNDSGFQLTNSLIALGNGGLTGQGLGNSLQKQYYLPFAGTDFVFATIGEELGFIGAVAIILVFLLLTHSGFKIAAFCQNEFLKLLSFGFTLMISLQALLHIAVVSGLLPTKGIGLPFISYGGSSLVVFLMMVGIIYKIGTGSKT